MTIQEMIDRLEEFRDELGGDTEVRLMMQPAWPFEYSIGGMTHTARFHQSEYTSEDLAEIREEDPDFEEERPAEVLYLLEGEQLGYGTKAAFDSPC